MVISSVRQLKVCLVIGLFCFLFTDGLFASSANSINREASFISVQNMYEYASGLIGIFENFGNRDSIYAWGAKKGEKKKDTLKILRVGFQSMYNASRISTAGLDDMSTSTDDDVVAEFTNDPLVYPNPFRQSSIRTSAEGREFKGPKMTYTLSKPMDLEFHLYDMLGRRLVTQHFTSGSGGGGKYNVLPLDESFLDGHSLSVGVYFYLFIHEGKVLARGKMAVKP